MIVALREIMVLLASRVVEEHQVNRAELGDRDLRVLKDKGDCR